MDVSIVCPFYNEAGIIQQAVRTLIERLDRLDGQWELIVVNDGSTDGSERIVAAVCADHPRVRLVGYPINRGRGHALRTGIEAAQGAIVVTTEIDLSWGEDIVERLVAAMREHPDADLIAASPHLPGGGYRNVPLKRVLLSRVGNRVIRFCMSNAVTMNTGMTRAYRREAIRSLPLDEDGKEFHLEVILKAEALKYRMREIPCVLEWKTYKHEGQRVKRKSSSKVNRLIVSHTLFSLFANPIRYVWGLSAASGLLAAVFFAWGVVQFALGLTSVFLLIISLSFAVIAMVLFALGVIAQQGHMIQREMWSVRQMLLRRSTARDDADGYVANDASRREPIATETTGASPAAAVHGNGAPQENVAATR